MREIVVVPYDDKWPEMFEAERFQLQALLGDVAEKIHHIGSTSVPGLPAKPVIDILLEVSGLEELDEHTSAMSSAGYVARGENGIAGRRFFMKGGDRRTHHVHAFSAGDAQIVRHLAFRDCLRKNSGTADSYAELKRTAALLYRNDAHRYSAFKAMFIEHHLQVALMDQHDET